MAEEESTELKKTTIQVERSVKIMLQILKSFTNNNNYNNVIKLLINYYIDNHTPEFREWLVPSIPKIIETIEL